MLIRRGRSGKNPVEPVERRLDLSRLAGVGLDPRIDFLPKLCVPQPLPELSRALETKRDLAA